MFALQNSVVIDFGSQRWMHWSVIVGVRLEWYLCPSWWNR